ncbi:MAG: class I SAM-dependent methyltransferase [Patescibacteria group bacterium]|nr:class I SAM-dependent methyltransferase [Patescibacteria group bacterium]
MLTNLFWKKYFSVYDVLKIVIPYQNLINEFLSIFGNVEGKKILDVGAGTGNFAIAFAHNGATVSALDNSDIALDIIKDKNSNIATHLINLSDGRLPFEDESFDGIVCNNVIYTINAEIRKKIFEEFYRVLKKGGMVVVSNVKEGWSPFKIYMSHLNNEFRVHSLLNVLINVSKMAYPTFLMFYYNYLIKKEGVFGDYDFMRTGEQAKLMRSAHFVNISDDKFVYAGQAILNTATK